MNYMTAMDAAAAAETAAGTHVLGLFKSANAYDAQATDDDTKEEVATAEVASVGAAIAAAAEAADGNQAGASHRYCCVGCRQIPGNRR